MANYCEILSLYKNDKYSLIEQLVLLFVTAILESITNPGIFELDSEKE